jgi:hypothetical protein
LTRKKTLGWAVECCGIAAAVAGWHVFYSPVLFTVIQKNSGIKNKKGPQREAASP